MTLYLHGLGHAHPETEIDNRFLESLGIGTDDAWIVERTGIRARRTVLPLDYLRATRNRDVRAADPHGEADAARELPRQFRCEQRRRCCCRERVAGPAIV